ncbi:MULTISPECIES: LapA family protein [Paracoccus]|uniref:LapA family protein n=1 Tax=Paracoccus TaxID=265 RepID=UPI001FB7E30A|nr:MULTISPECIES: LapA family protein [Paracoccus]MCJ1899513.1 lipopolysaccharide assembly protein LapA domain-containing protein [Paracoccus versutus]MDF3904760.1 LapA family protein [Paracoccus sp. AS002]
MRTIRVFFLVILAIVLMLLAAANRQLVTVSLVPEALAQFAGGRWSLTMPAFVALFLAMVFGVLVGLVWEWLRESHLRAESSRRAHDLAQLQREVGDLRRTHAAPRDDVLAILDESGRKPAAPTGSGSTLPAPR